MKFDSNQSLDCAPLSSLLAANLQVLLRLQSIHSVVRKNAVRTLVTVSTPGSLEVLDGLKKALQ